MVTSLATSLVTSFACQIQQKSSDADMFEPKLDVSNIWRGILENSKYLKQGIGNEQALQDIPLIFKTAVSKNFGIIVLVWKWNLFKNVLPREVVMKIVTYELTQGEEHKDQLVCHGALHGRFSFKSAISIVRVDLQEEINLNEFFSSPPKAWLVTNLGASSTTPQTGLLSLPQQHGGFESGETRDALTILSFNNHNDRLPSN
ncbi:hypothetical protein Cgig2_027312 [Carnegiea gigantea]|uniref:Uncharacterized protein n=1 Tax=Carnegiea gigantea TaxID=171969 RepID=A0A9Q1GQ93_9CARY|nr:hypothetical protein Cgig2_027312 [Carnegiea gigantea]